MMMMKEYYLNIYKKFDKFIFLDTETTGFSKKDEVVQIAFIVYDKCNDEMEYYNDYCKTSGVLISERASAVNGIRNEDLLGKPFIEDTDAYKALMELNDYSTCCIIHNKKFDLRLLEQSLEQSGVDMDLDKDLYMTFIDSLEVAKRVMNEKSYKLQDLRKSLAISNNEKKIMKRLGINSIREHDALGDVISLFALSMELYGVKIWA